MLIVHKVQLKDYEPCYVELLHLKELAEEVKNKVYSFLKEVTHKLKYLSEERDKKYETLNNEVDLLHNNISNLTATDLFDFRQSHQILHEASAHLEQLSKDIS